jgi:hypothetical protein
MGQLKNAGREDACLEHKCFVLNSGFGLDVARQHQNVEAAALHAPSRRDRYGGVGLLDYDWPDSAADDFLAA